MKRIALLVGLAAGCTLAGCGGSSPPATTTTTAAPAVKNLVVTPAIKAALLAAGAKLDSVPVSDFAGLAKGLTFYAYDPVHGLFWAGGKLVAKSTSLRAQVATQDDGAYDLFQMHAGGRWIAYADGYGNMQGTRCSIVVPLPVRTVWGWSTKTPCGGAFNT
jgi:hypothetical protein